jgi:gliding motility-associated-like protein
MQKNFMRAIFTVFLALSVFSGSAQCVSITNLPDTIIACKNTQVPLSATVVSPGLLKTIDTTWTPATGLSNANIINPVATMGTTSATYTLTIDALTPTNYVANGNFSGGNTGFTTAYTLGAGGSWGLLSNEGTYGIFNTPSAGHSNFASFYDHTTGTSSGSMLVVNGSSTANTNIWCQTITVVPNTWYDFSAWGATCVSSSPAILQFAINGGLLGTPLSLPSTTGTWVQFHTTWFSGANTSITICITDQQTAASGNDFAIDDIEFRQICKATDSVYIHVMNLQPGISKALHLGCAADTVVLTSLNNGGDVPSQYIWDFGDGTGDTTKNATHVYTAQGVYNIKLVTKLNGCADSSTTTVDTRHPLTIGITSDKDTVCLGTAVTFANSDNGTSALTYYWDFGDGTPTSSLSGPSHTYAAPGVYTVTHIVHDQVPCYDTITMPVVVLPGPVISFTVSESEICVGKSVQVKSSVSAGYSAIIWDFGDNEGIAGIENTQHAYDIDGNFTVKLTVKYPVCPDAVATNSVLVHPMPVVKVGPDTSICPNGDPVIVQNIVNDPNVAYTWNNGSSGPAISVQTPGIYWLRGVNNGGCAASDSLEVFKGCYLDIPNAFSPNGDGINDYFLPRQLLSKNLTKFHMQVFDRWGQIIFETRRTDGRGWDGTFNDKAQPQGVYVYLIEAEIDGKQHEDYQGNVTLIR